MKLLFKSFLIAACFLPIGASSQLSEQWVKTNEFDNNLATSTAYGHSMDATENMLVVGSMSYDNPSTSGGAVFVYENVGSDNSTEQIIFPRDHKQYRSFGKSVAAVKDKVVVGDYSHDLYGSSAGSVYVFEKQNSKYRQVEQLFASDGSKDDQFGVAVAAEDKTIVVGAVGDQDKGTFTGSAYVYEKTLNGGYQELKLRPSELHKGSAFGVSVAIDNGFIVVGAPYLDETGAVFVYKRNSSGEYRYVKITPSTRARYFGYSVDIEDGVIVVGAYASGSVYVYNLKDNKYVETELKPNDKGRLSHGFGHDVSIDDGNILVGRYEDSSVKAHAGSVYYFENTGGTNYQQTKIVSEQMFAYDHFGKYVALVGKHAVISAPGHSRKSKNRVQIFKKVDM